MRDWGAHRSVRVRCRHKPAACPGSAASSERATSSPARRGLIQRINGNGQVIQPASETIAGGLRQSVSVALNDSTEWPASCWSPPR